jgi:hypothetical protein
LVVPSRSPSIDKGAIYGYVPDARWAFGREASGVSMNSTARIEPESLAVQRDGVGKRFGKRAVAAALGLGAWRTRTREI